MRAARQRPEQPPGEVAGRRIGAQRFLDDRVQPGPLSRPAVGHDVDHAQGLDHRRSIGRVDPREQQAAAVRPALQAQAGPPVGDLRLQIEGRAHARDLLGRRLAPRGDPLDDRVQRVVVVPQAGSGKHRLQLRPDVCAHEKGRLVRWHRPWVQHLAQRRQQLA